MSSFAKIQTQALRLAVSAAMLMPGIAYAALPSSILSTKTLTYCSSMTQPPMEFVDAQQKIQGADIEMGDELAKRLGLQAKWVNIPFAGLIPALQAGQCDAIISQLFIKPTRLEVIDELPYMYSQEIILFKKGSPTVDTLEALSGQKVATVTGTTATILLREANEKLKKAGKKPIDIVEFPTGTAALQQLQYGQVAAYGVAYEIGLYYDQTDPDAFQIGGKPYFKILTGIGIRKDEPGLSQALEAKLADMMKDGSYAAIFKKWNLTTDMLPEPMATQK